MMSPGFSLWDILVDVMMTRCQHPYLF